MSITLEQVKKSEEITSYIRKADESLSALGFTEHSFAHVGLVSAQASAILKTLGYDDRTCELAAIAGWLHDIGNVINRIDHAQSGAVMAFRILDKMGASPEETATIITAIGNHDEKTAFPVNPVAAALILADKMDVRANRVREKARAAFDIHDRVNYSVKKHEVTLTDKEICLTLAIDTEVCAVIEYFEIFMDRMLLCRRAAEKLGLHPVMALKPTVSTIKTYEPGTDVSYGRRFTTERVTRMGVVPYGYADGFHRCLSDRCGFMTAEGMAPQRGRICMEMSMIDLTDLPGVQVGDEVEVFGKRQRVDVRAAAAGTIPYELTCAGSRRGPRVYYKDGREVEKELLLRF